MKNEFSLNGVEGTPLMKNYQDRFFTSFGVSFGSPENPLSMAEEKACMGAHYEMSSLVEAYGFLELHVRPGFASRNKKSWILIENSRQAVINALLHTDGLNFQLYNDGDRPSSTGFCGRTTSLKIYLELLESYADQLVMVRKSVRDHLSEILKTGSEYRESMKKKADIIYKILASGILFPMGDDRKKSSEEEVWPKMMMEFTRRMREENALYEVSWKSPTLVVGSSEALHYRVINPEGTGYEESHSYRYYLESY